MIRLGRDDCRNVRFPNCLVIGPQRAGTTWIHRYLASRGDVGLPQGVKETFFFDRYYHRGIPWYAQHFPKAEHFRTVVEVAPTYFHDPLAPKRVRRDLGDIALICTLRDPVERMYSLYLHMRRYGMTRLPLRAAVAKHPELLCSSRYATNLARWFSIFGQDKMLVLYLDTLRDNPHQYVRNICNRLQIPFVKPDCSLQGKINGSALPRSPTLARAADLAAQRFRSLGLYGVIELAKRFHLKDAFFGKPDGSRLPSLGSADRLWLKEHLQNEIESTEHLLGVDLRHWKSCVPDRERAAETNV